MRIATNVISDVISDVGTLSILVFQTEAVG